MGMSEEVKAKADVFLHQHIDKMLEFEYSNCDDPSILRKDLQRRFNHQREVLLPYARDEWSMLVTLNMILANYIQWTGYVKRHLKSMGALATIQEGNKCTEETKAKADVFLHQHIDEMLEFECGSANHWSKACRIPSHLCELYEASRKGKEKEVNHVDQFDNTNTELVASDFFDDLEL
ncbi:hypothetical protein Tco_1017334 [Tanacetum coccineum]|uniref:Uncharacterized protein n=1 Tax=Tanacetum coccineum TaxID=301880 RepID=A0ABQ5FS97_9ASTR